MPDTKPPAADPLAAEPDAVTRILALGRLEGGCRLIAGNRISGWARSIGAPDERVVLELLLDGAPVATFRAEQFRKDLLARFPEDPRRGFTLQLDRGLTLAGPRQLALRRAADAAELPGSPLTLPHTPPGEADQLAALSRALDRAAAEADEAGRAALARQVATRLAELLPTRPPRQQALLARWGLADPFAEAPLAPQPRPRALVIDEGVPDPARDAGSAAVVSHMRALLGLGFRVEFVPSEALDQDGPAARALAGMGVVCWQLPWIASVEEVLRGAGPELALVYLHRYASMQRYGALVRHWAPRARLVYSLADLHWLRAARAAALPPEAGDEDEPAAAPEPLPEAVAALRAAELTAALAADAVITHSSHEAALLAAELPQAAVHLLPWAVAPRPVTTPFDDRTAIAFVGSYAHAPNLDAALVLLRQVMPLVWAEDPTVPLLLAGSDLPASLRDAAEAAPGPVEVLGHVPDLAAVWERTRMTAAPLRFGAGLKGKVLDSLAAGLPCLCSAVAAEGMDLPESLATLVADTPEAMAATLLRLYDDEAGCAALGQAGLDWIADRFSAARIEAAMRDVAGLPPHHPPGSDP